jgi:3-hydroxyacyl-[acyl-carrier-protein] dehydratase
VLKDNFYTLLSSREDESKTGDSNAGRYRIFSIELNPEHPVYKGHFPGNPVVPGVCQVQIIGELFSGMIGKEVILNHSDNIKFMNMINPRENPVLSISLGFTEKDEKNWNVTASITGNCITFLKFRGGYVL